MKPSIEVHGVSKQFLLGRRLQGYRTLRDTVMNGLGRSWARLRRHSAAREVREPNLFWALKDVSFQIQPGDVVGVIGRNGSGKSTLLKILSRIYEPTSGRAVVRGRLASLLEVGTGFHPELTGRENIYLNGSILGMTRREIMQKFDEIVDFSGIEQFLDTPVKRYSSGMYVRLAFSVAAHLQPEILIVDEVLAVGDAAFQRKCLGKMGDVAKGGRTILFVSHSMQAVASLCNQGVMLQHGEVAASGPMTEVIAAYTKSVDTVADRQWSGFAGDDHLALLETALATPPDDGLLRTDRELRFRLTVRLGRPVLGLVCAAEVSNEAGTRLIYSNYDDHLPPPVEAMPAGVHTLEFAVPPNTLAEGNYQIDFDIGIHRVRRVTAGQGRLFVKIENIAGIGRRLYAHTGLVRPAWPWTVIRTDPIAGSSEIGAR
jgi:lipopolysaccharide transport system ATP-binding protein